MPFCETLLSLIELLGIFGNIICTRVENDWFERISRREDVRLTRLLSLLTTPSQSYGEQGISAWYLFKGSICKLIVNDDV